jgi:N-acetylglucosaminyldiphosphoundecaprenol N-acetyl-beta-D-mannosaminyltransferase
MSPRRIEILGIPVDCLTRSSVLERLDGLLTAPGLATILAVNPEKVMKAREDRWLAQQLHAATLLLPDGIGIVWAARILKLGQLERVAGADLAVEICGWAAERGHGVFLYGAAEDVNRSAAEELQRKFPRLTLAGRQHGYVPADAMPELIQRINASGARILLVALGSPRQEHWIADHRGQLQVKICQGVGGTFDVLAGTVRRAPVTWQKSNLEWAYRLLREPRRLVRQVALPAFAWRVLAARFSRSG